jgi:serine phosphatase RsbU (regulator of sigma subunit)
MPGLRVWLHSKPHGGAQSGGDVYYLSSCASGRVTRLLLADVAGHGESAAETAVHLRDLMRRNINRIRQDLLVAELNDRFSGVVAHSGAFATAVVSTFFRPTRSLTVSLAGHPSPLIYRLRAHTWELLSMDSETPSALANLPLGVTGGVKYSEMTTKLERGDMVLMFTDGLSEARDQRGQLLETEGLLRLASQIDAAEPSRFLPTMLSRIDAMSGQDLDDMTAILVEATESRVSLRNNLLAPLRLVRSLFSSQ